MAYDLFHIITRSAGEAVIATLISVEALSYVPEAFPAQPLLAASLIIVAYVAVTVRLVIRAVKAADRLATELGAPSGIRKVVEAAVASLITGLSAEIAAILVVMKYGERVSALLGVDYATLALVLLTTPLALTLLAIAVVVEAIRL